MRLLSAKVLLAASAVVAALGVAAIVADNLGLAILSVLVLQSLALLVVLDTRHEQHRSTAIADANTKAIAQVGREVAEAADQAKTEALGARKRLKERAARSLVTADRQGFHRLQEVEAMFQLFSRFQPRAVLPSAGRWALDWTTLLRLVDFIERRPIMTIVELGSGTSTLWLSYALERRGTGGRIISLDHELRFGQLTRDSLAKHGFADGPAEVRDAPLVAGLIADHAAPWYDPAAFEDVRDIDLLVVDGPPQTTGDLARYPALPLLLSRLSANAIIVIDDAARPDEIEMVERWMSEVPGLAPLEESGPSRQVILLRGA